MDHWHKIETAPKDGRILIFSPDYPAGDIMQIRIMDAQFAGLASMGSHWMPLPQAPTKA
jgi:hypothetical protein